VLVVPDAPFPTLAQRWRRVEELGFDFLFVADHFRHTSRASLPWFDGWTVLAAMALHTTSVRIGPLVGNPVLRGPAVLARAAAAIDHLSTGRLELGLGKGVEEFDHLATGTPMWSPRERAARFREYVQVVDGVLRGWQTPFGFDGRYYRTHDSSVAPAPVQRPRPPLTVGGQSPTVRRVAAERADCWNTFALGDVPLDHIVDTVRQHNHELDELCTQIGRNPATLRRSLALWKPLDPWDAPDAFTRIVTAFRETGITEFIVMWPPDDRLPLLEHAATTMTSLKARAAPAVSRHHAGVPAG
jgi:alkanesulfonate monooxygenase SsuD/methylene tetrahydromethanopterin reductase-like flavin-dependent oxidoreductase (luciferase family)